MTRHRLTALAQWLRRDARRVAERWAGDPGLLVAFGRWADAAWRQGAASSMR